MTLKRDIYDPLTLMCRCVTCDQAPDSTYGQSGEQAGSLVQRLVHSITSFSRRRRGDGGILEQPGEVCVLLTSVLWCHRRKNTVQAGKTIQSNTQSAANE